MAPYNDDWLRMTLKLEDIRWDGLFPQQATDEDLSGFAPILVPEYQPSAYLGEQVSPAAQR